MTRTRILFASLVALLGLSGCQGFREAMTGHVTVVARAGSQELTVTQLAEMLAPTDVPLRPDVVRTVAQIWVNYQLVGYAAARGDSLAAPGDAEDGMWASVAQLRTQKLFEKRAEAAGAPDPATFEKAYNDGVLLAASHILLSKQPEGLSASANDSVRNEAERIAARVTSATFAATARARSQDPGSKDRGGDYGVFPPGQMVAEFDAGIRSVPPGGITKVVETQYGYHIIRRHTWDEIKDQFGQVYAQVAGRRADSVWVDGIEKAANIRVRSGAPKLVKAIAEDADSYRDDRTVLASSRSGDFTAARMARYVGTFPPRDRGQIVQAPDSLVSKFVGDLALREVMLRAADSAKIELDSAEMRDVRNNFATGVMGVMSALNVAPGQLADSGADRAARERLAAARVDAYLPRVVRNEVQYIEVAEPIAIVLRDRYEWRVTPAGVDRVVTAAGKLRAAADSARAAGQPPSVVPMPGTPSPSPQR